MKINLSVNNRMQRIENAQLNIPGFILSSHSYDPITNRAEASAAPQTNNIVHARNALMVSSKTLKKLIIESVVTTVV